MSQVIHARRTAKNFRYRIWSTVTDSYITDPMTEKQLAKWELDSRLDQARRDHEREFPERLERASKTGTSSRMGDRRDLEGDWDKER